MRGGENDRPFDVVIRGGLIVDGTGDAPYRGDIAFRDGRIAAIGGDASIEGASARTIDAEGCWVTPGLIDPHTHLDAQLCWDASGSPSNRHGVTTVILGLCGFGVAPCPEQGDEYLLRALEVVEEIPYASTRLGVPFEWRTWREYRDYLDARPLGVNAAGFVPHSALRYFAMGDRARTEPANEDDRAAMARELEDALDAGAIGFATSRGPNHVDGYGEPMPSRLADHDELAALVGCCQDRICQFNVETKFSHDAEALIEEVETYAGWAEQANARMTWTPFYSEPGETVWQDVLAHNDELNERGISVSPQVTAVPITLLLRFNEKSFLTAIPGWEDPLRGFFQMSKIEKKALLEDPEVRQGMKVGMGSGDAKNPLTPNFDLWTFTLSRSRPDLGGKTLAESATLAEVDPIDLLLDVVIADDLETLIEIPVLNRSPEGAIRLLEDRHTLLGLGDAGAHVMSVTNYRYPTFLLTEIVRDQGRLSIELAINRMTRVPARMHGLTDRGELAIGFAADVCIIDPDALELGTVSVTHDLPGGGPRLLQPGFGFRAVFVNGVQTVDRDELTGATPGTMLRAQ